MDHKELVDSGVKKRVTGKLLVIFVVMMVLLTFFSNTINNFTLPRVTLESPTRGALIKEISGEGTVEAKSVHEAYTDANLKVLDVNVEVGDTVKKGQTVLSLDIDELKSGLEDENAKYRQMQITLDKLRDSSNLLNYENAIESALEKKEKQTKYYQDIKTLFDAGGESASNLKNAETAIKDAEREYNQALQAKEAFIRENQRNIENAQLNLEIAERKIESLKKKISSNGVYTAPADGIITELNFSKGSVANSAKPFYKLAETAGGFELAVSVDRDLAGYVKVGEKVDVDVTSLGDKAVAGKITQIKESAMSGDYKDIVIEVNDEELQGGETAQVYISRKTKQYGTLVPNSAIYSDSNGYYVYIVKKKDTPLGTASYVRRVDVTVDDSDSKMTALVNEMMPMDKIVTKSTKTLSDGDRVVVEQ